MEAHVMKLEMDSHVNVQFSFTDLRVTQVVS